MNSKNPADAPQGDPSQSETARSADDSLPPVQAPNASFLLQLFFIPLIIVAAIVLVWGMFSWLAHMGTDPKDLVKDLRAMNDSSWQRAYQLSEHLRNPEYAELKRDQGLADDLIELLDEELDDGQLDRARINLRIYLCRALGEFELANVADVLSKAAVIERDIKEVAVRRSAMEGLATLANHVGAEKIRDHEGAMQSLLDASHERSTGADETSRNEIRSTTAFAMGVIGGAEALDRLTELLDDSEPNVSFNAATGLARNGDRRCVPILVEMLDPDSQEGVEKDLEEGQQVRQKLVILTNAIMAASRLRDAPSDQNLKPLEDALQRLIDSDPPRAVRYQAQEAKNILRARK
jgi:hypothetical protein